MSKITQKKKALKREPITCGREKFDGPCENPGQELHGCPYAEDICGDYVTRCTCCKRCTHECAMDI